MDEQRKFFRIKNKGEMQARFETHELAVIDVSASSMAIKTEEHLPPTGIIEFKIHRAMVQLNYELLRTNPDHTSILIFNQEEQNERLLTILKNLRDEQRKA